MITLAPDIERTDWMMNYTVSLEFATLFMTLCLTCIEQYVLGSCQHITYPLQGGVNDPVHSFLICRTTWNNASYLSNESLSVRSPYFLHFIC
jgi:hypothetical protein